MKQGSVPTGTSRYIIIISTFSSSLGRPLDSCMSTSIALWFSTYIDVIEVQVNSFVVFEVQVDVSIVLGIQVDRSIDFGV